MAYETGIASSRADLISKLCTFAVANGWTQDEYSASNERASLHKSSVYVHFWWEDDETTQPVSIGMYQSLGFSSGQDPPNHTDDAGGSDSLYQDYQRKSIKYIGDGPFTAYHFFSHGDFDCIYCVLEYTAGIYRHFGFGELDKFGTWTGGEFVYGHCWHYESKSSETAGNHSILLDGLHTSTSYEEGRSGATIHIEDMPNQDASSKWGLVGGSPTSSSFPGTDRAGEDRVNIQGGARKGIHLTFWNWLRADSLSGLVNLCPISCFYSEDPSISPRVLRLLGFMPHVYQLQIAGFEAGDEITIGADTYKIFPAVRKRHESDGNEESLNNGIAYKKVT